MRDNINGIKLTRFTQKIRDFFNPEQARKLAEADIINDKFVDDMNAILEEVSQGVNIDQHLKTLEIARIRLGQDRILIGDDIKLNRTANEFELVILRSIILALKTKYGHGTD